MLTTMGTSFRVLSTASFPPKPSTMTSIMRQKQMAKYLEKRRRRKKALQALWAPRCPCPGLGDTHVVVAISTTIMARGIQSPKQLTTDTTWGGDTSLARCCSPPHRRWHPSGGAVPLG